MPSSIMDEMFWLEKNRICFNLSIKFSYNLIWVDGKEFGIFNLNKVAIATYTYSNAVSYD